ncbi:MAG: PaaI family thioesterase [Flavobacteriales bacterium]|nr:PaaI family thioesterase [Flavobacteriales bacterium]
MEKLLEIYNRVNQFGKENGLELTVIKPGEITYKMEVLPKHLATPKTIHGGMIAAMMDGVIGVAALSLVAPEGRLVSTVEYKINYFKPSFLGDTLTGKGRVDNAGKRIIHTSGEIYNQHNEIIAKAMGTFNAYPIEKSDVAEYIKDTNQQL